MVRMDFAWQIAFLPSKYFFTKGQHEGSKVSAKLPKATAKHIQTGESSIQTIILPQSLSDWQYLGDTCSHKLSFGHLHLEVSKHRSAWETDVLCFLKTVTIRRCGSPALYVWLRYSELILFPWLSLCDIKVFQALVSAHLLISRQLIAELAIL